jgi:hypothetical protein
MESSLILPPFEVVTMVCGYVSCHHSLFFSSNFRPQRNRFHCDAQDNPCDGHSTVSQFDEVSISTYMICVAV